MCVRLSVLSLGELAGGLKRELNREIDSNLHRVRHYLIEMSQIMTIHPNYAVWLKG